MMIDVLTNFGRPLRGCLILLLVVGWGLHDLPVAKADEGLDDYKVAVGYYRQKRWQKAAEQFRKFLETYEKHEKAPLSRLYLGLSLLSLDDYKAARVELRKFADENKKNENIGLARFRIGECSYLLEDLPSAKVELDTFVTAFPDNPMCEHALPYLGDTLLRVENPDPVAALTVFERAIAKFPQGQLIEDAKFGRARSLESLKKFDEAVVQYQELATRENNPRAADALFHLGVIHFERNDYPRAVKAYSDFVEKYPQNPLVPNAQLNVGYALFYLKKYDDALKQFEKVAREPSQKLTATYWQGRCLKSIRDYALAADVLKNAAKIAVDHPLAEAITFERALCERNLDHPVQARQFFEQVLKQFPTGDYADDSLHYLIEMSIEADDLAESQRLLEQFRRDFSNSPHRLLIEMLNGRLDLARARQKLPEKRPVDELNSFYESAAQHFELVLKESSIPRAKRQARYYLALTNQLQEKPKNALEMIAPLVDEVIAEGTNSDFTDPIVLQADCFIQIQDYEKALAAAATYLKLSPNGRQAARALSIQALSAESLKNDALVKAAVNRLGQDFADNQVTVVTMQKLAEAAENRKDFATASQFYESIANSQKDPEKRVYAIRGIALSQYSQDKYREAADTFGRVIKEFPNHEVAVECAYYQADSLRKEGNLDKALEKFQNLFNAIRENEPAKPGAEMESPLVYYYKAGQLVTHILTTMNKVAEADAAYEELLKRFPHPTDLDGRLKDWALLNHNHERFERSDEIWRRLLNDVPQSPYVDLAKLNLAESDLFADRLDQARQAFEGIAETENCKDEIRERALFQLLTLAVEQGRWTDVRSVGDRLITLFPKSDYRHYVAYSQAEIFFSSQERTDEDSKTVREKLKSLQEERSNEEVRKSVWFERVWVLLAELNFQEKDYDGVVEVVNDLKKLNLESPFLYQAEEVLGRSYKQQAPPKFDDARAAFESVISNRFGKGTETAAKAQLQIGHTYVFQNKLEDAVEAYNKVFSLYDFPYWKAESLLATAQCDELRKDWKAAVNTYKLLIESFPDFPKIEQVKSSMNAAQKRAGSKAE